LHPDEATSLGTTGAGAFDLPQHPFLQLEAGTSFGGAVVAPQQPFLQVAVELDFGREAELSQPLVARFSPDPDGADPVREGVPQHPFLQVELLDGFASP
jgi:hypothetical protein